MQTVIYFDRMARSLRLEGGEPAVIRAKSFAVFLVLARAYPEHVTKDTLIHEVWDDAAVSDDSITQCIATIRRALGDKEHRLVQTNQGLGYRLMVPAVEDGAALPPEPRRRPAPIWAGALAVAVLALGAAWGFLGQGETAPVAAPVKGEKPSVAVLTFDVLGQDLALESFAQGLQSDIIVALSELDTVSVLSPTALAETDRRETPLRAYVSHGVRYVVGGTVQRTGDALRVSGQLIDTESSRIVWTRPWKGEHADLHALQDKVVAALAGELANPWSGRITGLGAELAGADGAADGAALIRLGASRFEQFHALALDEAETSFRKALELDAHDAEAWAGLSFVLGAKIPLATGEAAKALRDARANSGRQAYHLGDGSGRSLLAGSWTAALRGNRRETLRRLQEGAALLGSDGDGLAMAAIQAALTTELYTEAVEWGDQALALKDDPPSWYYIGPAYGHLFQGAPDRALEYLRQAPDGYAPTMALLASLEQQTGQADQARATAARLRMLHHDFSIEGYLGAELVYPDTKRDLLRDALSEAAIKAR